MNQKIVLPVLGLLALVLGALGLVALLPTTRTASAQVGQSCPANLTSYWKLDELGNATTFVDTQGTQEGTCSGANCPGATAGKVNSARLFDGGDDEVSVAANPVYDWAADDSFSIAFWMKGVPEDTCASGNEVMVGRGEDAGVRWWVGCVGPTGAARFQLRNTTVTEDNITVTGTEPITDGAWHHITAVRDGDSGNNLLYVDGVEVGSASHTYTAGFSSATADITLGWYTTGSPGFHFSGTLDEVAIFDRALTPTEIARNYAYGLPAEAAGFGYCASAAIDVSTAVAPAKIRRGDDITFTYSVTNPGDVPLSNVAVNDAQCSPSSLASGDTDTDGRLDSTETWTVTCSRPVNTSGNTVIAGTAFAEATDPADEPVVSSVDNYSFPLEVIDPAIALETYTVAPDTIRAGEMVTYTYTVKNTGDDPLTNVQVTDTACGSVTSTATGPLDPAATRTFTCKTTRTATTTSTATARGTDALANLITSSPKTATVQVLNPSLTLTMIVNKTKITKGETVTYTYTVENKGNDPLANVSVTTNPVCSPITSAASGPLASGATRVFTCSQSLTETTTATATAQGTDSTGETVQSNASDPVTVTVTTGGGTQDDNKVYMPLIIQ